MSAIHKHTHSDSDDDIFADDRGSLEEFVADYVRCEKRIRVQKIIKTICSVVHFLFSVCFLFLLRYCISQSGDKTLISYGWTVVWLLLLSLLCKFVQSRQ